jgi:hypothetical protein
VVPGLHDVVVDELLADVEVAVGDRLEAGDHAQRRRLAAAGRAKEADELPLGDVEREAVDRMHGAEMA